MSQRNAISRTLAARFDSLVLTLGGLLPAGVLAVERSSNQPIRCRLELRRVRVQPVHIVDRNHRRFNSSSQLED
jgi:hypothetical protein